MRYKYEQCPKCAERGADRRGDNLAVYEDGSSHCYSCAFHTHPKSHVPLHRVEHYVSKVLPAGFSRGIPSRAWQWLLQFGMPYSHWLDKVGWDEASSRLVFAVPDIRSVAFSQGRLLQADGGHSNSPKWLTWGQAHQSPYVVRDQVSPPREDRCVVLVEDWISANKIASMGVPSISLFGTSIFPSVIPLLRYLGTHVVLWLDNDQRGTAERKGANIALLTGLPCRVVYTQSDPKLCSAETIKETLK